MTGSTPAEVLAEADGPVGRITLNRPERRNAITVAMGRQLGEALRVLGEECAVLVVRGAGGTFCAGGDFDEVQRLQGSREGLDELFAHWVDACLAIASLPVPVVAAVEGAAMAGGFELLCCADIALVRADAKLGDNHLNVGMVPGGGGSQWLPRLVGRGRALGHILTGERLTGAQAADWGIAYRAFAPDEFEAGVETVVQRLAGHDRAALARAKRMVVEGPALPLREGLALERELVLEHLVKETA